MGSSSDYCICEKCGNNEATIECWYHTGEYTKYCDKCGWSESHMLDYNSRPHLYNGNLMPIDKSILDLNLPDFSDHKFYDDCFISFHDIADLPDFSLTSFPIDVSNEPLLSYHMHSEDSKARTDSKRRFLFALTYLLFDPIRFYIEKAVAQDLTIKDYADEYIKQLPFILKDDVAEYISVDIFADDSDFRDRCEQFLYEFYVVEVALFDKYKHGDMDFIRKEMDMCKNSFPYIAMPNSRFYYSLFGAKDAITCFARKFIDISEIITEYREKNNYITFAFWYINRYFSNFSAASSYYDISYELLEDMNRASNNVDYACGRYHKRDSDEMSLYLYGYGREIVHRNRNVVCYIHADSDEEERHRSDEMKAYADSKKYKYYRVFVDRDPLSDHTRYGFRSIIDDICSASVSRLIVFDKYQISDEGFDIIDYLCYKNHVNLDVISEPDRKSIADKIQIANTEICPVFLANDDGSASNPFNIFGTLK